MATTEQIQALADLAYAAQTTGVPTAVYNAAKEAVGLDPDDYQAAQDLLESYGYAPGSSSGFYKNSTLNDAPLDAGLAAHYNAVNTAINEYGYLESTTENLEQYSGKIDPSTGEPYKFIVNDNVANAEFIKNYLQSQGSSGADSVAITPDESSTWQDIAAGKYTESYNDQEQRASQYYGDGGTPVYENALQWAEQFKRPTAVVTDPFTGSPTSNVTTGAVSQTPQTQITGGSTGPTTTPYYSSTPNLGVVTPTYGDGQTGLTEVAIPTYEQGLQRQADQFQQRAVDQQQYYQPQTLQEQQAAGTAPSFENVLYRNKFGMSMYIQHINGIPSQPIPQGYYRVTGFGTEAQTQAGSTAQTAQGQNQGGMIKGFNQSSLVTGTEVTEEDLAQAQRNLQAQAYIAPGGAIAAAPTSYIDPNVYGSVIESTAGQALPTAPMVQADQVAQIGSATTADTPLSTGAAQVNAQQAAGDIQQATAGMTAAQLVQPTQTIQAQQQTDTAVSGLTGAVGESVDVTGAPTRTLQTGETITGTGVDQAQVGTAFGTGEVQAASVQDELANLMQQFEGGDTPAWAAGSMRAATQMLAARGLGASSLAGQAVIQAAMESALPIAQIDTANKQQVALFKAEQRAKFMQMDFDQAFQAKVQNAARVSEIANMNFTAEQQIALENSKAANTMALQNLTNQQAIVMSEAAALSQLDMANLNNRQQAAVQNAQNFLQVDMSNLNNAQQTALFKQQSLVNSILSDQAAANAAQQFNATSENQTNQFFANLAASVNQFNAAQINAMKQFNADEVNTLLEFNAGLQDVRERFNAQNYLAVAQANAQWRQNLATINTAAANESNMEYTRTVNGLTMTSVDEIWQRERDILSMAFQMSENNANRANAVVLEKLAAEAAMEAAELEADVQAATNTGNFMKEVFLSIVGIG